MREIKFRAWFGFTELTNEPQMQEFPYAGMVDDSLCFSDGGYVDGYFANTEQPIAVMQYTGLKDKNGKEIYEGDILYSGQTVPSKLKLGMPTAVFYDDNNAHFGFYYQHKLTTKTIKRHHIEIIGNIYENPELVGGQS